MSESTKGQAGASIDGTPESRRRGRILLAGVLAVVVIVLGADVAVGVVAQGNAGCEAIDDISVDVDIAPLPVTSGLITGSIGTASALVPWSRVEEIVVSRLTDDTVRAIHGESGLMTVEATRQGREVRAGLRPEIGEAGKIELALVSLNVDGRDIPPALARIFGGGEGILQAGAFSGGVTDELPFEVASVEARTEGLQVEMRIPRSAITSRDNAGCSASIP